VTRIKNNRYIISTIEVLITKIVVYTDLSYNYNSKRHQSRFLEHIFLKIVYQEKIKHLFQNKQSKLNKINHTG